jgi:hypothetical protein
VLSFLAHVPTTYRILYGRGAKNEIKTIECEILSKMVLNNFPRNPRLASSLASSSILEVGGVAKTVTDNTTYPLLLGIATISKDAEYKLIMEDKEQPVGPQVFHQVIGHVANDANHLQGDEV